MPSDAPPPSSKPVIKCESVYKIFGENAKKINFSNCWQSGGPVFCGAPFSTTVGRMVDEIIAGRSLKVTVNTEGASNNLQLAR